MVTSWILDCEPDPCCLRSRKGNGSGTLAESGEQISPDTLARKLRDRKMPVQLVVPDRLLAGYYRRSREKEDEIFPAFRQALFQTTLRCVVPLATSDRSFNPRQTGDVFSLLIYEPEFSGDTVHFCLPQNCTDGDPDEAGSWVVNREDIYPERRLDPWYYQGGFVKLRKDIRNWSTPTVNEAFDLNPDKPNRLELSDRPQNGALHWLSSAQIHEDLDCVALDRLGDAWGSDRPPRGDARLDPGDFLLSMAGSSGLKIAEYYPEMGPATRSAYLEHLRLRASQKNLKPYRDTAVLWWVLRSDYFFDQIRMHLSDRVITPLKHVFPGETRLPPLELLTKSTAVPLIRLARLLAHAAASQGSDELLKQRLVAVAELLSEPTTPWIDRFACIRAIRKAVAGAPTGPVLVLADRKQSAENVARDLNGRGIPAAGEDLRYSGQGMTTELAEQVVGSRRVVMLTDARNPMRLQSEHVVFTQSLDILGPDHVFGLCLDTSSRSSFEFPGRQLLKHIYSEAAYKPNAVDVRDNDIAPLVQAVMLPAAELPPSEATRLALMSLAKLGTGVDATCHDGWGGWQLDFLRPYLTKRSLDLAQRESQPLPKADEVPRGARVCVRALKPHRFGERFATANRDLAERIRELEGYLIGLKDVPDRLEPVVVLIEGETGTGKDILADHILSSVFQVNTPVETGTELTDLLAASQLFGHEKGAFTGADTRYAGVFEQASKAKVLKLNEINSYSLSIQFRLLRVLETGRYSRVGSQSIQGKDAQCLAYSGFVFALSNENLHARVLANAFRLDLLMRMDYRLVLPALRNRPDDIDMSCQLLLESIARRDRKPMPTLTQEAMDLFHRYGWPGNVRELKQVLQRAVRLGKHLDGAFLRSQFPEIVQCSTGVSQCPLELGALEKELTRHENKKEAFRAFKVALSGDEVKADNLAQWVRLRKDKIRRYAEELPNLNKYLADLQDQKVSEVTTNE